jgi:SAM-dependent methyltransferase
VPRENSTQPMPVGRHGGKRLGRLLDFAEPAANDVCLDVTYGGGPVTVAVRSRVRQVVTVDAAPRDRPGMAPSAGRPDGPPRAGDVETAPHATFAPSRVGYGAAPQTAAAHDDARHAPLPRASRGARDPAFAASAPQERIGMGPDTGPSRAPGLALPYQDGAFTLVIAQFPLFHLADPPAAVREMLRMCHPNGRLIIADQVRTESAAAERDRLERMHDPAHSGAPSVARLIGLLAGSGGGIRRVDVFSIERPAEPWLAEARDEPGAAQIRAALIAEVDGGPPTGARPRMIGGELWFTQRWAYFLVGHARPARTPDPYRGAHAGMGSARPGADGDRAAPPRRA